MSYFLWLTCEPGDDDGSAVLDAQIIRVEDTNELAPMVLRGYTDRTLIDKMIAEWAKDSNTGDSLRLPDGSWLISQGSISPCTAEIKYVNTPHYSKDELELPVIEPKVKQPPKTKKKRRR